MRPRPALGLLLLTTLVLQVSSAEDLYWEGEEDAANEFLEVREESSLAGHIKRIKRAWNWLDPFGLSSSTTTAPPPENEINTEDPAEIFDPDVEGSEGSGSAPEKPRVEPENRVDAELPGEKTLRVTFVVVQPYQEAYSNRDSAQFQQFSKTLAQAVDALFVDLPGTQKASLIRIQSRPTENFSCKVTLEIVTLGYDNTDRIRDTLRDHIRQYRNLGNVSVNDEDFSASEVNPGSPFETCSADQIQCDDGACISAENRCDGIQHCSDNSDEQGCPIDERINTSQQESKLDQSPGADCPDPIPCAGSSITICGHQRCDNVPDCPYGDDEQNCGSQGAERGDQDLFPLSPEPTIVNTELPETTPSYSPAEQDCLQGEFRCDETRCILKTSLCDGRPDCSDGSDELNCPGK